MAGQGPTVARLLLGDRLRELRTAARIEQRAAADAIRASVSKISRMESGQVPLRERDVKDLLTLYRVTSRTDRAELLEVARRSCQPGWWDEYSDLLTGYMRHRLSLEAEASQIRIYDSQAIPVLLQTDLYTAMNATRELDGLKWRGGISAEVIARRRAILDEPGPPQLWVLIQESALYRAPANDLDILRGQLVSLVEATERPNIQIQLIPDSASAVLVAPGPFSVLRYGPPEVPDLVWLEDLQTIRYTERHSDVDRYNHIFNSLATQAITQDLSRAMFEDLILALQEGRNGRPGGIAQDYLHERLG